MTPFHHHTTRPQQQQGTDGIAPLPERRLPRLLLCAAAVAGAALLGACNRPADTTGASGTGPGAVVADASRSASQVGETIRQEAREAGQAVADKTKDVAITAEVNTLLARDDQLSALKIDVDTSAGQVVLQGIAPSDAARSRAADLARSVGGVLNVDNRLQVARN